MLQQYLQKRPGLLSELCELLQSIQAVGPDAGVAALRVTGAILDSRFGQSRSEASQLSQMLGLSLPHGIVACALRGLLGHQPAEDKLGDHNRVLLAALDLFQITTVSNHQTTAQLGHAGMILAMLELMQKTDVASLPAVTAMLRCLELAAEVSGTAALVLFRDFSGLQAVWWGMPGDLGVLGEFWVLDVFVESVWACTPEDLAQTPDTKVPLQECKVTPSGPRCWLGDVGWLKLFLDLPSRFDFREKLS
ncbi:unnamed protein product [Symbiodinium natans]|uniref:Uncharacterized protein n=1 Tax=Symbiodinium natans TaxID=878477 RepID=A0A812LJU2_9DINO|nr:unnamed protein product [Symbiodinium natans]